MNSNTATPAATDAEANLEELGAPPRSRNKLWIVRIVSIIVMLLGWEYVGRQVNPLFMSYPTAIARAAVTMIGDGELFNAMITSLRTLVIGFIAASIVGIGVGLLIGRYRAIDAATDWLVNALYSTPLIAVIPLVILWFGLGDKAKFFIVALMAVFPVLINTAAGVRNLPAALIDVGVAFAANERQVFLKIIFPGVLPYIMTGLRLGVGRAIIAMVAAEFFTAINGLGALIVKYGNQYDTASMFVPILVLMILGVTLSVVLRRVEEWFAPWRSQNDD